MSASFSRQLDEIVPTLKFKGAVNLFGALISDESPHYRNPMKVK
jgi:hypothetical protein